MRRPLLVAAAVALTLALGASESSAWGARGARPNAAFYQRLGAFLAGLRTAACTLGPAGLCAAPRETGCEIDPDGRCATRSAPPLGETGCEIDPLGRCTPRPAPPISETGCEIDPWGRCGQ